MNPITELKKIIQSINEDISRIDKNLFQNAVLQVSRQYETDQPVSVLIKMIRSLGTYLLSKKDAAHQEAVALLNSMVETLDLIISVPAPGKDEITRQVSIQMQRYKSLKNKIASKPVIDDKDIDDLKAVILAIDWEVSDTTLKNFENVVSRLLLKLENYKIHHTFLKIIHSTGRYIGSQKANAHKDSISFLRSVFENFQRVAKTPDMTFKDKKYHIESDIHRFHEFKQKIAIKKSTPQTVSKTQDDEFIQPALSHVNPAGSYSRDTVSSLTPMPDQEDTASMTENRFDSEPLEPALTGKRKAPTGPRDIMDDLFSIKESPADELLDAIHLMDVHGTSQTAAMQFQEQDLDSISSGIKKFTPQRMDNMPIPEIDTRLDEFFNLDVSHDTLNTDDTPMEESSDFTTMPEEKSIEDTVEGIVPFQYEDETVEDASQFHHDSSSHLPESESDILIRIEDTIQTADGIIDESDASRVQEDILRLKNLWIQDSEKTALLRILGLTIQQLLNRSTPGQKQQTAISENTDNRPVEKTKGVFAKLKGLFTS